MNDENTGIETYEGEPIMVGDRIRGVEEDTSPGGTCIMRPYEGMVERTVIYTVQGVDISELSFRELMNNGLQNNKR